MFKAERLKRFRKGLYRWPSETVPRFQLHRKISDLLTERAISLSEDFRIKGDIYLIILNDDEQEKGNVLAAALRKKVRSLKTLAIRKGADIRKIRVPDSSFVAVAVFSETKAWKGGASTWLFQQMAHIKNRADLFISFGSPYLFHDFKGRPTAVKLLAYWDSEPAQRAVAEIIERRIS